jgi:selenocysteine lyase/cysteine desulfurase
VLEPPGKGDVGGIDFVCGTGLKWMMGGYGLGLFYVKPGWLEEHGLPWAGWLTPPDAVRWQNFPGTQWEGPLARGVSVRPEAAALEAGGGAWPAIYAFEAALTLIESAGIGAIHAHNLALQRQLRAGLEQRGFRPTAPLSSGICVVRVAGSAQDAARALFSEGVVVSPRAGGVRFSTHIYNDASDVQRALEAIDRLKLAPA